MNTTKKGDQLENQVYTLLSNIINRDEFLVKKDYCKIFLKKKYYSKDRKKDIIFDVAIEAYFPGQDRYSMLFLIECKNYNHKVPVDDVEEFYAKAQQIGSNIKTIIASTNSFQQGSLNFSKSKGIGLFRYYSPNELVWELVRSPSSFVFSSYSLTEYLEVKSGITDENYRSQCFDFYGYTHETFTNSTYSFFSKIADHEANEETRKALLIIRNKFKIRSLVKHKSKQEIEASCMAIQQTTDYEDGEVPLEKIYQWLTNEHGLEIINTTMLDKRILGKIQFNPLKIYINKEISNQHRQKFTICHEIGHYFLGHQKYMKSEECLEEHLKLEDPQKIAIKDIMKMEFQANYFASCLLLPRKNLTESFFAIIRQLDLHDRGYGALYLDAQPCNLEHYYKVTSSLMDIYSTSRSVIKIRLKELGLLKEEQKPLKMIRA